MADTAFDLVVIGAGPGGYVAAIRAAQLGMKTAIVERENLGGICLNWGCIPTKALLRSSEIYHLLHRLDEFGFSAKDITFDLKKIVERSRKVSAKLSGGVGFLMKKHKITVFDGTATLKGKGAIALDRQGRQGAPRHHRQAHHPRDRRAGPHAAGPGAGRQADLDLPGSAGPRHHAEIAAGGRLRRHRHRIRQLLQHARRRDHGGRGAGPHPAGRGRGDLQIRAQELREAGHEDPHRRQGGEPEGRQEQRRRPSSRWPAANPRR